MGRNNDHSENARSANARTSQSGRDEGRVRELARAHRTYRGHRYRSLIMHWLGRWLRRPKRASVTPLPSVVPGQVGISFSGHSTVLLRYASRNIVCDPMLGKWVKGVKRAVMPGLTPADLHDVDVILISHAHQDHLHRPTLATLPRTATVILPPRTAQLVSDLGFARVVELSPEQSIQDHGVDIATARVQHGDDAAPTLSYVIRGDGPSVYFCGDSGYFPGFADIGARYAPDIALLPIGGYAPLSFRERHMSPLDALYALEDLGSRIMIPIHHGAFTLSYERLDEPLRWLAELVEERGLGDYVVPLRPGESRIFVPPGERRVGRPRNSSESQPVSAGTGFDTLGALAAAAVPGVFHALPATRALLPRSAGAEPAWVRGRLARPAAAPEAVDSITTDPMAAPELFPAIDAALDEVEAQALDAAQAPAPAAEVPDELIIEQISVVHSEPIELEPRRKLDPPAGTRLPEAAPEAMPEAMPEATFDELEAAVAARFTDDSAPVAAALAVPLAALVDERTDRQQMRVALEHSSAPNHRVLSGNLLDCADDLAERAGDSQSAGHRLEPVPAFA